MHLQDFSKGTEAIRSELPRSCPLTGSHSATRTLARTQMLSFISSILRLVGIHMRAHSCADEGQDDASLSSGLGLLAKLGGIGLSGHLRIGARQRHPLGQALPDLLWRRR